MSNPEQKFGSFSKTLQRREEVDGERWISTLVADEPFA